MILNFNVLYVDEKDSVAASMEAAAPARPLRLWGLEGKCPHLPRVLVHFRRATSHQLKGTVWNPSLANDGTKLIYT